MVNICRDNSVIFQPLFLIVTSNYKGGKMSMLYMLVLIIACNIKVQKFCQLVPF